MFSRVTAGSNDVAKSKAFYDGVHPSPWAGAL